MAPVKRRRDLCDLFIRSAKRVREIHRELIVSIGFIRRNSRREITWLARNRRRVRKHCNRLFRWAHGENSEIPIAEIAVVPLSLKIGKDLDWPIRIRAERRPRLNSAVHVDDALLESLSANPSPFRFSGTR